MVAVVINNSKCRKIERLQCGKISVISAGTTVGRIRLKHALAPYGDGFIFGDGVPKRGLVPFNDMDYKNDLLFYTFLRHVLSKSGLNLTAGIMDPNGRYLPKTLPIIRHCSEVIIVTAQSTDRFAEICLAEIGTCPFITSDRNALLKSDICFAPEGVLGFYGELFGLGGMDASTVPFPPYCTPVLNLGVSKMDLAAVLYPEEPSLAPKNLLKRSKDAEFLLF
jgi:hypothetical protein